MRGRISQHILPAMSCTVLGICRGVPHTSLRLALCCRCSRSLSTCDPPLGDTWELVADRTDRTAQLSGRRHKKGNGAQAITYPTGTLAKARDLLADLYLMMTFTEVSYFISCQTTPSSILLKKKAIESSTGVLSGAVQSGAETVFRNPKRQGERSGSTFRPG